MGVPPLILLILISIACNGGAIGVITGGDRHAIYDE